MTMIPQQHGQLSYDDPLAKITILMFFTYHHANAAHFIKSTGICVELTIMQGVNGPTYPGMMIGLNQVNGVGTKIQRAFAPSPERYVVGSFGLLHKSSEQKYETPSVGRFNHNIKGLMINIFA